MRKKITFFEILVFIAYAFFILLGLTWFIVSFMSSRHFNYQAFMLVAVFGIQAYFRHRLTNLILGILALFLSLFMLLDVINDFNLMAKDADFNGFIKALIGLSLFSVIMSGILILSYTKLSFKDQEY